MKILKRVRCLFNGGHQFKFRNNMRDGDRALVMGARSVWVCPQCKGSEVRIFSPRPIESMGYV